MKKMFLIFLIAIPMCGAAQVEGVDSMAVDTTLSRCRFGVINYKVVLESLPEWKEAQERLAVLSAKCNEESERSEREFQRKFAEFLEGQKDFPQNIMEKRQKELQGLLEESVAFRRSVQQVLKQKESELVADSKVRLDKAMAQVAMDRNLLFIFDVSSMPIPFVDSSRVIDVGPMILDMLLPNVPQVLPEQTPFWSERMQAPERTPAQTREQVPEKIPFAE